MRMNEYPMQPILLDTGRPTFEHNPIVCALIEAYGINNVLALCNNENIEQKYLDQLYQLWGYSVGGFCELYCASDEAKSRAESMVKKLLGS